ncbi:MAG: alkaline phosphatase family protein [Anaerolineae bacterium]|nr:alkaline phosphatase family protein [Anaerolineae bacterium]
MSQSIKPPRLLVIGLDGATFDLLEPMAAQGWLPNLSHVLADSARGVLRSTVPPLTAPAWTSFQTGLRPGSHGVFSFQRRLDATLEREFVNSTAIHGPRLWHWLARHGLTTGVVNLPMTWPPLPMPAGSYVVTGMETPDTSVPFTDPPELADELRAMNYVCDLRVKLHERDFRSAAGVTSIARDLLEVLRLREQAVFKLLAERPTDALVVVFETPDRLQHWAWRAVEQLLHNNGGLERTPLHESVRACYEELDRIVGRLLDEAAGAETHVFFVSDHGFGPMRTRFHVDQWLATQGWLTYAGGKATVRQRLREPLRKLRRFLPRSLLRRGRRAFAVSRIIDWQQTQAYSGRTMEHAIYVNQQGREPEGVVPADEVDALRRAIVEALLQVRDPATGNAVVPQAWLREDLYQGAYVADAPDLLFSLAPGYEPTSELSSQGIFSDALAEGAGIHQPAGIFMAMGPSIVRGETLPDASIEDVLPTMLYALGLPVSTSLEGQIIVDAFDPAVLAARSVIHDAEPLTLDSTAGAPNYSADEAGQIAERLAALGYLS